MNPLNPKVRIAVPEDWQAAVEAASVGLGLEIVGAKLPPEGRTRAAWMRLWQERRAGGGASLAEAEAGLQDGSVRAVLMGLERGADAALVASGESGAGAAWNLPEVRGSGGGAAVWMGGDATPFAWCDWRGAEGVSAAADQMVAAVTELQSAGEAGAVAVVVDFSGGKHPLARPLERFCATLQARMPALRLHLYSPLFYRDSGLQASALLQKVRAACGPGALPVLCIPQLRRTELAAAWRGVGGTWSGPLRCGSELPLGGLAPGADAAQIRATAIWLARWAAGRSR